MSEQKNSETNLGKDAVLLTASRALTLCIAMITTRLLSGFRSLDEYGTYSQLLLVVNLFTSFFMLGLPNSINYFLARCEGRNQERSFLSTYYLLATILSIIIGIVIILCEPLIENYFDNPEIKNYKFFLFIFPWTNIITSSIENVLVAYKKTSSLLVFRACFNLCLFLEVIIIQALGLGFSEYMKWYLFIYSAYAISVYIIVGKQCGKFEFALDKKTVRAILVFSLPLGVATIVGTLDVEIDKLLIGYMMNTEQMAIYSNAAKELPLTIIASSITAVLLPRLSRLLKDQKNVEAIELWGNATELSFIFMTLFVSGIFVYAKQVIEILYSDKYLLGLSVFRVYSLVLLLRTTYFGIVLNSLGKTKTILLSSVIALLLNAILNPIFYYAFGMVGPAVATFVSLFVVIILQLILTSRYCKIDFKDIFPWGKMVIVLLINCILAGVFGLIKALLPLELVVGEIVESIFLGAIWCVTYLLIVRKRIFYLWKTINNW